MDHTLNTSNLPETFAGNLQSAELTYFTSEREQIYRTPISSWTPRCNGGSVMSMSAKKYNHFWQRAADAV